MHSPARLHFAWPVARVCVLFATVTWVVMAASMVGCSASPSSVSSNDAPSAHIATVFRSKCGSCHTPIEPGVISHERIETAMQRHRKRARLTDREWSEMVDFLAAKDDLKWHDPATLRAPKAKSDSL